ncbi:MAG: hypothetical protein V3S37_02150 [Dehalococcoidia bacterium]
MKEWILGALVALSMAAPAQAEHTTATPHPLVFYVGCLDADTTLALVESTLERGGKIWEKAVEMGVCYYDLSSVELLYHAVVGEAIWGGDDERSPMYIVEAFSLNGRAIYGWVLQYKFGDVYSGV